MERSLIIDAPHALVWARTHEHKPGSEVFRDAPLTHKCLLLELAAALDAAEEESYSHIVILGTPVLCSSLAMGVNAAGFEMHSFADMMHASRGRQSFEHRVVRLAAVRGVLVLDDGDARVAVMGCPMPGGEQAYMLDVEPIAPRLSLVRDGE